MPAPAKKKEDLPAPAKKKEAGPERSLYMLEGSLEITYGEEKFEITPEMALLVPPGTPFGIKNAGRETASFILTYSPPPYPEIKSREDLRKLYEERMRELYGRSHVVKSPEEMKELRGRKSA